MWKYAATAALLFAASLPGPAWAASCPGGATGDHDLLSDALKARQIVSAAAARLGGIDRLRAIKRLQFSTAGYVSNALQEYDPALVDRPTIRRALTRDFLMDLEGHRYRRTAALGFDGATLHFSDTFGAGKLWTASSDTRSIWTRDASEASFTDSLVRYVPALVVLRAVDNVASATWAGEACPPGSAVDLVDFSWTEKSRLRLSIARSGHDVVRLEMLAPNALVGDNIVSYQYSGTVVAGGVRFPALTTYSQHGVPFTVVTTTGVDVNPALQDDMFERPAGYAEVPAASPARAVDDGVFELNAGGGPDNYVHFFDLGDSVAVFDAPDSADDARDVANEVHRLLGNKPIRYVVISHFHDDHAAGVGFYADLGAKIVTTRDSADVLARYAHAASVLAGKAAATTKPLEFLFVDGDRLTIPGTGGRSITVYRLNNLPHVKAMLVAYYPTAKTIVNSDLYGEFAPFDTNSLLFSRWLRTASAPDVQWIAGGHHRRISQAMFQQKAMAFRGGH